LNWQIFSVSLPKIVNLLSCVVSSVTSAEKTAVVVNRCTETLQVRTSAAVHNAGRIACERMCGTRKYPTIRTPAQAENLQSRTSARLKIRTISLVNGGVVRWRQRLCLPNILADTVFIHHERILVHHAFGLKVCCL
jgi:hypothetical protein